jgi:flagellar hook assembly protein FlgD
VDLAIHSVDGRRVRTLAHGMFDAGEHVLTWEGTDDRGVPVRPGLYFVRLDVAGTRWTRTLVRIR